MHSELVLFYHIRERGHKMFDLPLTSTKVQCSTMFQRPFLLFFPVTALTPPPRPQEQGRREKAGLSLSSGVPWGDWFQFIVNSLNCRLVKETADRCRVSIEHSPTPFPCAPRFNTVSSFSQLEPALSSFNSAK